MSGSLTFTIIKPDAVKSGYIGEILSCINKGGFKISGLKLLQLTLAEAEAFYGVHRERPFFSGLVSFMTSGPIVVAVLEKENAINDFRALIGSTNPEEAAEGTIRKQFAKSMQQNAVHGSDSDENAAIEVAFFFATSERF